MTITIWQTSELDYAIAEQVFGWEWWSYERAVYPPVENPPRSRQFMSPHIRMGATWADFSEESRARPAEMTEPVRDDFQPNIPHYSGDWNAIRELEDEIRRRGWWDRYREELWAQIVAAEQPHVRICRVGDIDEERLAAAECEPRCRAALAIGE